MNKITIWWILAAYTAISIISALTSGEAPVNPEAVRPGAVNLAACAGVMVAFLFYTRRYVPEKRGLVYKVLLAVTVVATVVSIIIAITMAEDGKLGTIVSNVGTGVCTAVLVLLANHKKFEFIEECSTKKFVIITLVALLVLPTIMYMLSGLVATVISIVIVIAFGALMFSDLGSFMASSKTPVQTVFRDDKGYQHNSLYDAEKANEKYKAQKKDD